jgi:tetratricopeptide (TPR) repeat protein
MMKKLDRSAGILAGLLAVFLTAASTHADVALKEGSRSLEITGGNGSSAWKLRYGTFVHLRLPHQLVVVGDQAYFSHGLWLRRIDPRRGVVTGRWHFPWAISQVTAVGGKLNVEIAHSEDIAHTFKRTIAFDPENEERNPQIPNWPVAYGEDVHFPIVEATGSWGLAFSGSHHSITFNVSAQQAREALPEVEEMVRRDPLSPWFQITRGVLLKALGDSRAAGILRDATATPRLDYSELIRMSAFLTQLGERDGARESFERGYRDFLDRGFDPRMFISSWRRRELFPTVPSSGPSPDPEWIERCYRLAPGTEESGAAWRAYASLLEKQGQRESSQLWRQRADDPRSFDAIVPIDRYETVVAIGMLVFMASLVSGHIYLWVLSFRYRPQRLADLASGSARRYLTLLRWEYSNRRERFALLTIVFLSAASVALLSILSSGVIRWTELTLVWGNGSLAGPANVAYLERQAQSKDRDLLLAVAYQQSGEDEKAARLYRELPEFAESWNNLGVLLKKTGKDAEARAAFESALRLDPGLAEASLNLKGRGSDPWTTEYARLFPGRLKVAAPGAEHFRNLIFRGPLWQNALRAMAGPFAIPPSMSGPSMLSDLNVPSGIRRTIFIVLSLGIAFLLVLPQFRVSIQPGAVRLIVDLFLPGSSRSWLWLGGWLGGTAMLAWFTVIEAWLLYPLSVGSFTTQAKLYGYGIEVRPALSEWMVSTIAGALLFGFNLFLVWRSRRSVS